MKKSVRLICLIGLLASCATHQEEPWSPQAIQVYTYYKTSDGVDLLNQSNPLAYKRDDLKVVSKIEEGGVTKEIMYEGKPLFLFLDNSNQQYYFGISVPTRSGKKPIETYVTLSPTVTDTLTYTFENQQEPIIPDKIYYNKVLVWNGKIDPKTGKWPPIIIIR
ncbi:MAG: hypothetical protein HOP30_02740 [Cyclobacteriaceae bacterium]|nr:hypothetical protein [Cyclobacteriaceae bacterium]